MQGGDSRVLGNAVRERERRRDELQFTLQGLRHREWTGYKTNYQMRRDLHTRIEKWRGLLRRHPVQGQQILRKLIDGRLLMTPHVSETESYYEFLADVAEPSADDGPEEGFRVRVRRETGSRSRSIVVQAASNETARERALESAGPGWIILEVERV